MPAMRAIGVIPARWASQRFPGKPLAPLLGRPMLRWVFEGARQAKRLQRVLVATDDARIAEAARGFGAEVALTRAEHPTGTDRIAEVARALDEEIVVNVQGDEPTIRGDVIDAVVAALEEDPDAPVATAVHGADPDALDDPNRVKAVLDRRGRALWFSRARIPLLRDAAHPPRYWQHVGLYAYRRPFLLDLVRLAPTPCERAEALEQLRVLEHGFAIRAAVIEGWRSLAVDVPADMAAAEAELARRGAGATGGGA
jgi:3-deoxy-manno-octulosonate cytidylyltransferase (CMP-KDO synthetase)